MDDKNSGHKKENFLQPIEMGFLENQKVFLTFLLHFWNLNQFKSIKISKIMDSEKRAFFLITNRSCFRTPFHNQSAYVSKTLGNLDEANSILFCHYLETEWIRKSFL